MSKFTRGELFVECGNEVNTEQKNICRCVRLAMEPEEARANAALIAAAPDMYRMLGKIIEFQKDNFGDGIKTHLQLIDLAKQIDAILKKARGEE